MTKLHITGPYDSSVKGDYRQQARDFLAKSRECLAAGDLHRASEKGWRAAAWMVKAVALAQGWEYEQHEQFNVVLNQASVLTVGYRLHVLGAVANGLHGNFYVRKRFLDAEDIGIGLDHVAELLNILEPLTGVGGQQEQAGAPSFTADS